MSDEALTVRTLTDGGQTAEQVAAGVGGFPAGAAAFERDFEQLWSTGSVEPTGGFDTDPAHVGGATVRTWFAPGRGRKLAHRIATAIGRAERRVRIASPVITAGPILGTLADVAAAGRIDLAGILDATQMHEVLQQWHENPAVSWKPVAV